MKKWISCGKLNKYLFFPFIGGTIKFFIDIYLYESKTEFSSHPLIRGVNEGIGMSFSFIPILIIKLRTRKNNKAISKLMLAYKNKKVTEEKRRIKIGKYALLLVCSFFDFLQKYLTFSIINEIGNNIWIFD